MDFCINCFKADSVDLEFSTVCCFLFLPQICLDSESPMSFRPNQSPNNPCLSSAEVFPSSKVGVEALRLRPHLGDAMLVPWRCGRSFPYGKNDSDRCRFLKHDCWGRGGLRKLKWLKEVLVAAGLDKGIKNNHKQIVYSIRHSQS